MFILLLSLLTYIASAHFTIEYPGSRGFEEEQHGSWPCGGFNDPSSERVSFPLTGAPLQISSTHTRQLLQVVMAVGNNPGDNFDHVVVPTFLQASPQEFCFGDVTIPRIQGVNLTEGSNGTLQVISGGGEGGLYACVDVTFVSAPLNSEEYSQNCKNASGSTVSLLQDSIINANESSSLDLPTASGGPGGQGPAPTSSSSTGGASLPTVVSWVVGALGVAGGVLVF